MIIYAQVCIKCFMHEYLHIHNGYLIISLFMEQRLVGDFWSGSVVKNLLAMQETQVRFLVQEDCLEKGMATHSSILAWKISWTEGAWLAQVHEVAKCQTQLSNSSRYSWVFVWFNLMILLYRFKYIEWRTEDVIKMINLKTSVFLI